MQSKHAAELRARVVTRVGRVSCVLIAASPGRHSPLHLLLGPAAPATGVGGRPGPGSALGPPPSRQRPPWGGLLVLGFILTAVWSAQPHEEFIASIAWVYYLMFLAWPTYAAFAHPFKKENCKHPEGWEDMLEVTEDDDDD